MAYFHGYVSFRECRCWMLQKEHFGGCQRWKGCGCWNSVNNNSPPERMYTISIYGIFTYIYLIFHGKVVWMCCIWILLGPHIFVAYDEGLTSGSRCFFTHTVCLLNIAAAVCGGSIEGTLNASFDIHKLAKMRIIPHRGPGSPCQRMMFRGVDPTTSKTQVVFRFHASIFSLGVSQDP